MKIKEMNGFVKFITFGKAAAITLAPFGIYMKKNYMNNSNMINHEKIHWNQQLEMLILFFYFWYLFEWIVRLFTNFSNAYYSISFEREAYDNDQNPDYLNKRKRFAWFKYMKK